MGLQGVLALLTFTVGHQWTTYSMFKPPGHGWRGILRALGFAFLVRWFSGVAFDVCLALIADGWRESNGMEEEEGRGLAIYHQMLLLETSYCV